MSYADSPSAEQRIGEVLTHIDRPAGGYTESEIRYRGVPLFYLTLQPEQYTVYWAGGVEPPEFVALTADMGVDDRAECLLATAEAGEEPVLFQDVLRQVKSSFDVRFLRINTPHRDYTWHISDASPTGRVIGLVGHRWDRDTLWRFWLRTYDPNPVPLDPKLLHNLVTQVVEQVPNDLDTYVRHAYGNTLWSPLRWSLPLLDRSGPNAGRRS